MTGFAVCDQYSLTSSPNRDPSVFISFIGSSYSTSLPENKRSKLQIRFVVESITLALTNNNKHIISVKPA